MNLYLAIIIFLILNTILITVIAFIDVKIIPKLNEDSKLLKWWKKNIIDVDEEHI